MTRRLDHGTIALVTGVVVLVLFVCLVANVVWWNTYWGQWFGSNVWPPSIWTLVGVGLAHLRTERRANERHGDMKQHVTEQAGNG